MGANGLNTIDVSIIPKSSSNRNEFSPLNISQPSSHTNPHSNRLKHKCKCNTSCRRQRKLKHDTEKKRRCLTTSVIPIQSRSIGNETNSFNNSSVNNNTEDVVLPLQCLL